MSWGEPRGRHSYPGTDIPAAAADRDLVDVGGYWQHRAENAERERDQLRLRVQHLEDDASGHAAKIRTKKTQLKEFRRRQRTLWAEVESALTWKDYSAAKAIVERALQRLAQSEAESA